MTQRALFVVSATVNQFEFYNGYLYVKAFNKLNITTVKNTYNMYPTYSLLLNTVVAQTSPTFRRGPAQRGTTRRRNRMPSMQSTVDYIKRMEQRKLDNIKSAFDFIKETGSKDIQYLQEAKEWCEDQINQSDQDTVTNIQQSNVVYNDNDIFTD